MKRLMAILVVLLMVFTGSVVFADTEYVTTAVDHTTHGFVLKPAVANADGTVTVTIMETPNFEKKTYTTVCPLNDDANHSTATTGTRANALATVLTRNTFMEVRFNAQNEVVDFEIVEYAQTCYMDSASYGGELTAKGGTAGNMVAQGFVLGKNKANNTITIGDGNNVVKLFNETYTLADDCQIFLVDNSTIDGTTSSSHSKKATYEGTWEKVKEGATFDDITRCTTIDGEIYYVPERYMGLCIFDSNYQTSWEDGSAKVTELYLYANPLVLPAKDLSTPDGMTYDSGSWYPAAKMNDERTHVGWNGATEPTEYMANRLYDVGDSNTNIMMFIGDAGEITLLDMGNRQASYQYYLKIAKCGHDPRDVDTIFLTHGHGDHYEALYEFAAMIRRSGNKVITMANGYTEASVVSNNDFTFEQTPMITDASVLYSVNSIIEWDKWQYFMGKGTALYPFRAIGHSKDTTNYAFKLVATKDDKYFEEGEVIGWFYQGGFGIVRNVASGVNRLQFMASLMSAQSVQAPWLAAQCDKTYFMNQHTLTYPYLELDKAAKLAGVSLMSLVDEGIETVSNVHENRIAMMMYEDLEQNYLKGIDKYDEFMKQYGAYDKAFKERGEYSIDTLEAHGPWKRDAGEYQITIESVSVLHGYDAMFAKNREELSNQKNIYGAPLYEGMLVPWVSYSHDPERWYVQVVGHVNDDYKGVWDVNTNWYQGEYVSQVRSEKGTVVTYDMIPSGMVEMGNNPYGWYEVIRTLTFDSKEKAEEFAKKLTNGGYEEMYQAYNVDGEKTFNYGDTADHNLNDYGTSSHKTATYTVTLDKCSNIQVFNTFEETFRPAN